MLQKLLNKFNTTERRVDDTIDNMIDGLDTIDGNVKQIMTLLNSIQKERDYIDSNLEGMLKHQRNLALMESALATLSLVDDAEITEFFKDEMEEECDLCEEDDEMDVCEKCGQEHLFWNLIEDKDGKYICKECYKKQVINDYLEENNNKKEEE